jgi:S-formylglutathione hydrolase FrmB
MADNQIFELRPEHVTLLRAAYVRWEEIETGAPAIDCKRPYGNSDVAGDVIELLGWQGDPDDVTPRQDREDRERAMLLHQETETALQVILSAASFEPGIYTAEKYGHDWHLQASVSDD